MRYAKISAAILASCITFSFPGCVRSVPLPLPSSRPESLLPIRIASVQGVVTYSGKLPDEDPEIDLTKGKPAAKKETVKKTWSNAGVTSLSLVQSSIPPPGKGPTQKAPPLDQSCLVKEVTAIQFLAANGAPLLTATPAGSWNTVVVESPSGFAEPLPNDAWGLGWPIKEGKETAQKIVFDGKFDDKCQLPKTVQCDFVNGCLSLRVELK